MQFCLYMMTSWNENTSITDHLWAETTDDWWTSYKKASHEKCVYFLCW